MNVMKEYLAKMKISVNLPESFLLVYKDPELALKELIDSTLALQLCNHNLENNSGKSIKKQSRQETSRRLTA